MTSGDGAVTSSAYSVPLRCLAVLWPVGRGADAARRGQRGDDWGSLAGVVGAWQGWSRGHGVLLMGLGGGQPKRCDAEVGREQRYNITGVKGAIVERGSGLRYKVALAGVIADGGQQVKDSR